MSISLKDAFRAMNILDETFRFGFNNINTSDFCKFKCITKTSKMSTVFPDKEDKVEVESAGKYNSNSLINAMLRVSVEIERLTDAIDEAKKKTDIDKSLNKASSLRQSAQKLTTLLSFKDYEEKSKTNVFYLTDTKESASMPVDTIVNTEYLFDYSSLRNNVSALLDKADKLSAYVEKATIETQVDYDFPVSFNSSKEEILLHFGMTAE